MKKLLQCLAIISGVMLMSQAAYAGLVLADDWTLDLGGVTGQGLAGQVTNIDEVTYVGPTHALVLDANANGLPDAGERFIVDGLLYATGFDNDTSGSLGDLNMNTDWEMTFDFSVEGVFTGVFPLLPQPPYPAGSATAFFTHVNPVFVDGKLDIWVDNLTDGSGSKATPGTGLGYQDGTLIASFVNIPGLGGSLNTFTEDGSDDAMFNYITGTGLNGVLLSKLGIDLVLSDMLKAAMTDSNFDLDPLDQGLFSMVAPTNWPFPGRTGAGLPISFFAKEDGSSRMFVVPEPTTMLLFGMGLAGVATRLRKRKTA